METIRIHEVKQPDRAPRLPALLQVWEASVRATLPFGCRGKTDQEICAPGADGCDAPVCGRKQDWRAGGLHGNRRWPPGNAVPLPG